MCVKQDTIINWYCRFLKNSLIAIMLWLFEIILIFKTAIKTFLNSMYNKVNKIKYNKHMKKRKTLTKDQKFTILLISSSIINAAILAFTISSLNYMMDVNNSLMMKVFLSIAFFFLTLSSINLMLVYKLYDYNKIAYIKHIVFAVIYLLIAVAFLLVPYEPIPYYILWDRKSVV